MRSCVLVGCLALGSAVVAQRQEWLPIAAQDWALKEVPGDPGASAIQLYYAEHNDDNLGTKFFYHRIKVLNEKALEAGGVADVEILVPPDGSIADLRARTVHPDGNVTELTEKPFQKVVFRGGGVKVQAKAFTFPAATVGSILEYKYVLRLPANTIFLDSDWTVQHELFTVKESLTMIPYLEGVKGFERGYQVSEVSTNMPKDLKPQKDGSGWKMSVENVAAFVPEGYMPPEDNYKPTVRFFYSRYQPNSDDKFWQETGKTWYQESEHYIGDRSDIKAAAQKAIGAETDPEKKLRLIYARAQKIRNLSFERERTEAERQKENLRPNQHASDVLSHGYGEHSEINRLFVALARAAGFEASILPVSNRKERIFNKALQQRNQFDTEIALVKLNGSEQYLDPGTPFCPFGLLRWINTSAQALRIDKKGGTLILVPPATQDKAVVRRTAKVALDPDGTLKGSVAVQFNSGEGLERRLQALITDDAGRQKMLEDEMKTWLPDSAIVKFDGAEGWVSTDDPLTANFSVEIPVYASSVGKRLVVPSYLFQSRQLDAFKPAERKYPVYFPYAFAEIDNVNIKLPSGYSMESVPAKQEATLRFAKYQSVSQFDGVQLITQRGLLFNGIYIPLEMYPEIRDFFNKVQAGDEQQAVLQGGGVHAQKNN